MKVNRIEQPVQKKFKVKLILIILVLLISFVKATYVYSQEKTEKPVKEKQWKIGFSLTGFYDPTGSYEYFLNPNSTTTENHKPDQGGAMLSSVLLFKVTNVFGLTASLPIADYTSISSKVNVFNKISAAGFGPAFKITDNVYVTAMVNYGEGTRLNPQARVNQQFPLNVYPTLHVNGVIPDETLAPYADKVPKIIYSGGLVFFLD